MFLYVLPFFLPAVHLIALDSQSGGELESLLVLHGLLAVQKWERSKKRQVRHRGRKRQTERQKVWKRGKKSERKGGTEEWSYNMADRLTLSGALPLQPSPNSLSFLSFFFLSSFSSFISHEMFGVKNYCTAYCREHFV